MRGYPLPDFLGVLGPPSPSAARDAAHPLPDVTRASAPTVERPAPTAPTTAADPGAPQASAACPSDRGEPRHEPAQTGAAGSIPHLSSGAARPNLHTGPHAIRAQVDPDPLPEWRRDQLADWAEDARREIEDGGEW